MTQYDKLLVSLRYFLLGKEFYTAVDALEYGLTVHKGVRKDGVTPEFQHQIEIAHFVRTLLPSLMYPEQTLTAVLLHDVPEDYDVAHSYIAARFGDQVSRAVMLMDKTSNADFQDIALDPIASIVKGGDRIHNMKTMNGVFTPEKQLRYAANVRAEFLPMLKRARRIFPRQEAAYENLKHMLEVQVELVEAAHQPTAR